MNKTLTPIQKFLTSLLITVSVVYLINPTAGLFELLPDNIPFIGNIDETLAAFFIFSSISYLRTGTFNLPSRK